MTSHNSVIFPQQTAPISVITAFVIHSENMIFLMRTLKKQSVPHPSIQMAQILNNSFEMGSKYIQIDVSEMSCILNTFAWEIASEEWGGGWGLQKRGKDAGEQRKRGWGAEGRKTEDSSWTTQRPRGWGQTLG